MLRTLVASMLTLAVLLPTQAHAADAECTQVRATYDPVKASAGKLYAMSYCAARDGDREKTFELLDAAIARGYSDVEHMKDDPDFVRFHADPRWGKALDAVKAANAQYLKSVNAELYAIVSADQDDRNVSDPSQIDWSVVAKRDAARQTRVREILATQTLAHADDYWRAALIMQHGGSPEAFREAHELALKGIALDPKSMKLRWLACAAEDRHLQSQGKPQIWGTQFLLDSQGRYTQEPFDRTARSDAERDANGVPSLAQSQAQLEELQRQAVRD